MKRIFSLLALCAIALTLHSQSIYDIQGQSSVSPYTDSTVSTQGIVTSVFPSSYFLQDGDSAWCGIYVYDDTNIPEVGDSVSFTALVDEFYSLTELKNIENFIIHSSGNSLPMVNTIKTGEAEEKWESVLVKVDSALCTNPDAGFGEWELNDGSGALLIDNLGDSYKASKDIYYTITGPLNYSYSKFKIAPRSNDDIIMNLALYITENPNQGPIEKNSLSINFATNDSAYAVIEYGLTPELELGKISSQEKAMNHSIDLNRLDEASVYYTKAYAYNELNDTTPASLSSFATKSSSSGKINVTFVKPSVINTNNTMIDSLVHYIAKANTSLDIAIYDLTNHAPQSDSSNYRIINAINEAYASGVSIRLITDNEVANTALDSLNSNITILRGNEEGIMHNKFLIIDRNSINNSWVVTGSTNWTYNNLIMDFNNLIAVQDQSLARAYTVEFEEMWGSRTMEPNTTLSRFGSEKIDNTPHHFDVNGTMIELYFSPSDDTEAHIQSAIESAESSVDFSVMVFTVSKLYNAIIEAHNRGLDTRGVIDYVEYSQSNFDKLVTTGVDVVDFANADSSGWPEGATCHHKYVVMDVNASNPLLITGTHNWSASANSKHDENTLFIYNKEIAQQYVEELNLIRDYIDGALSIEQTVETSNIILAPNPCQGSFTIHNYNNEYSSVIIYNVDGTKIKELTLLSDHTSAELKNAGLYILVFKGNDKTETKRLLVK